MFKLPLLKLNKKNLTMIIFYWWIINKFSDFYIPSTKSRAKMHY